MQHIQCIIIIIHNFVETRLKVLYTALLQAVNGVRPHSSSCPIWHISWKVGVHDEKKPVGQFYFYSLRTLVKAIANLCNRVIGESDRDTHKVKTPIYCFLPLYFEKRH